MNALLDGIYDGDVSVAELLTHGDFGVGTFNHLDGEMVILDGVCYHLRVDGSATVGGYALDFELGSGDIAISPASEIHLSLPRSAPFLAAELSSRDTNAQIRQAEGG